MYSMWLTEEQQRVWRGYLTMTSRLQTAMHRQLQHDCELSLADYDVLVALSERGPQRVNELGEALGWEQSRLSHQLRRMRGRGLVVRHGSDDDRRGATVELTADGRAALEAAAPGHVQLVREAVFDGMTAAQLRAVEKWIETVTSRLRRT
jgi:DNA-binding MarR family transcriptional regulator